MTCKWCPSRLACEEYGCRNPPQPEVTDEMLVAAMRAFERMSSVLRYREKDKWHSCDMMGMRDAIKAAIEAMPPKRKIKPRLIIQHYEGPAVGGPFDGCDIECDVPSVPDEQGGSYNFAGGKWRWVAGLGTALKASLDAPQSSPAPTV